MFRKWSTSFCVYNILIATHLQPEYTTNTHEMRGEHSVRCRKPIHRARIFTLSNMRFRSPFCGCTRICKHQKIVHQRTLATRYGTTTYTECLLLQCKNPLFARQKPYFCNAKNPILVDAYIALIKH